MHPRLTLVALGILATLLLAGAAFASVIQSGNLRVTVLAQVKPYRLPRTEPAPIAVFIAGHIANPAGGTPPQLRRLTVRVNRHGLLDDTGLPICHFSQIQPGSAQRALERCSGALVGSGRIWASVVFPDQRPYATHGRVLVFNGRKAGKHVLFAHIYSTIPFSTSFVMTFAVEHLAANKTYGTQLSSSLPQVLGDWGFIDRLKLTLRRTYHYRGKERSYFNAACPAPEGTQTVSFPLALATLSFAGGERLSATVNKSCRVKE
ncbi:MAG TPA: hypothetical protein VGO13_01780 [Solirubrobacterales bacterium]|nr:hypothetical protein [Solirubrobacterales bacterium]